MAEKPKKVTAKKRTRMKDLAPNGRKVASVRGGFDPQPEPPAQFGDGSVRKLAFNISSKLIKQ